MSNEVYKNWKRKISSLEEKIEADPLNLDLAYSLWSCMKGPGVYDLRSGKRLVSIFRHQCLQLDSAAIILAQEYKELFNDSGEAPSSEYIDEKLLESIKRAEANLTGRDLEMVKWLLDSVL